MERTVTSHLEDGAHFSELLPRPEEPEGQDRAHVLRYGVEVGDEAVRNLRTHELRQNTTGSQERLWSPSSFPLIPNPLPRQWSPSGVDLGYV